MKPISGFSIQPRYHCYVAVLKFDGEDKSHSYMIRWVDQSGGETDPNVINEMMEAYSC